MQLPGKTAQLSGRIRQAPSSIMHDEILEPQFRNEVEHLLPWYILVEKVLLLEHQRLGLVDASECSALAKALHDTTPDLLIASPSGNLSDLALALERHVEAHVSYTAVCWHVDRSRNDLQASAQLLFGREQITRVALVMLETANAAMELALDTTELPMPGYTQLQAAQVTSPAFHLTALTEHLLHTAMRLAFTYDSGNLSPLGSGAMAGQELPWDRERMALLLGCDQAVPHALVAVASRAWRVEATADLSAFAVTLSRFITDLMAWGSGDTGFLDLPDELSGISAAMPQKKNFPILERIRGRAAHAASSYVDLLVGHHGVPYSNMIEVSKESGSFNHSPFQDVESALRLLTTVLQNITFRGDRMRAACERDFLGGFTLANQLTLRAGIPWRNAQVIAGQYIMTMLDKGLLPQQYEPDLLCRAAREHGWPVSDAREMLARSFDVDQGLRCKSTPGSAHPEAVRALLADQRARARHLAEAWDRRRNRVQSAVAETDRLLGLPE